MNAFIQSENACPMGLTILMEKCDAWAAHDHARITEATRREQEHLATCAQCNGTQNEAMLKALWGPNVRVVE